MQNLNKIEKLKSFKRDFENSSMWKVMEKTKEDSPWHREESVAIHTDMVLSNFENNFKTMCDTDEAYAITYLSLLFHDVGKPPCMVVKFKPERGHYNAFHGHEQISARMFEDFYVSNIRKFDGIISLQQAYEVMWMIENHLPYDAMNDGRRMDNLRTACEFNLPTAGVNGFGAHLLADTYGRISDDEATKRKKTCDFVEMLQAAEVRNKRESLVASRDAPVIELLVGASGSGKSSYFQNLIRDFDHSYFSFDQLRIELAKAKIPEEMAKAKNEIDEYAIAYNYCDKHRSEFSHYADVEFIKLVKSFNNIVVDNTNVSRKNRTKFIVETKKRGYDVKAVMFPISKKVLIERATTREDKRVPEDAIIRQYNGISIPWVGVEVDELKFFYSEKSKVF